MNNFERIRKETETIIGMEELFYSPGWEGNEKAFSQHAGK